VTDPQPSREWLLTECTRLSVACMELEGAYHDAVAERDRLRKVVDTVVAYRSVMRERTVNLNDGSPDLEAEAALAAQAHKLGDEMDTMLSDVANDMWHCRCGKRYPAHRKTCPTCGQPRITS
jgi:rubrerythrin